MKTNQTMAWAAAAALGLAAAAWAQAPDAPHMHGGPRHGGPDCSAPGRACNPERPGKPRGPHMDFAPASNPEIMAARRECRELARKAREAASDEERDAIREQLREKVRAETELVDRLQEQRLDAIAEAAQKRIEALRAQLADMREHREEFVEQEVERLMRGPRHPEGRHHGFPPSPAGEDVDGDTPPPPPDAPRFGRDHRRPPCGDRAPGKNPPCPAPREDATEAPTDAPTELPPPED